MVIDMNDALLKTIGQIESFNAANALVKYTAHGGGAERYGHISRVLKRFDYPRCGKRERGVLLKYLALTTGYSRPQVTRLVKQWRANRLAAIPL